MVTRSAVERILDPETVAVVGASTDPTKRGHQAIATLQSSGFEGTIYPVHPSAATVRGLPVKASIADIPEPVDVALLVVPSDVVPTILDDCAETDVAGAIVIAVGFGETDADGEALERAIVERARNHDVRLVGPNTSGLINVHTGANLVGVEDVPVGRLGLLAQSGNLALGLFTEAAGLAGVGFSHYVGVGNEADLRFDEYLPPLAADDRTDAVVCYVEGFADGRRFLTAARETVETTPIVVLKAGRSVVGRRAAGSHTGSLAGDPALSRAVLAQAGVTVVDRADELLPVAHAVATAPTMGGDGVGVLADGGGHGTLAADALVDRGLSVPTLCEDTQDRLTSVLPDAASVVNPVDVAGGTDDDPSVFAECAAAIVEDPAVDGLLVTGLFGGYGIRFHEGLSDAEVAAAEAMAVAAEEAGIPMVVQSAYASAKPEAHRILREAGVPVHESLEVAVAALDGLARLGDHRRLADRKSGFTLGTSSSVDLPVDGADGAVLSEAQSKDVLAAYGAPVTPFELARNAEAAAQAARTIDGPVAMKVVSPAIVHKTEAEAVALEVPPEDAAVTYDRLIENALGHHPGAPIVGVLVSPMRGDGVETIVGGLRDEQFGPVVLFGLGGVFVEVLEDVAFQAAPVTDHDARAMLEAIEGSEILEGARGGEPIDRDGLVAVIQAVSTLLVDHSDVAEVDCNPVLATPDGAEVLDASIHLDGEGDEP